jgi:hypothetical protein
VSEEPRRIEISWVQASAAALAAVSSAVLLSTVGVAGTIIGAALGSLAATIGSAVYSHYLGASRDRVAAAAAARSRGRRLENVEEPAARSRWREAFSGLPWRRLLPAAAGLFVAVMVVIVTFELIAGRAVSTYTGGSDQNGPRVSVPGVGGVGRGERKPAPSPSTTPSETPPSSSPVPSPRDTGTPTSTSTPSPSTGPSSPSTEPTATVTTSPPPSG